MKYLFRALILAGLALGMVMTAVGQDGKDGEMRERMRKRMQEMREKRAGEPAQGERMQPQPQQQPYLMFREFSGISDELKAEKERHKNVIDGIMKDMKTRMEELRKNAGPDADKDAFRKQAEEAFRAMMEKRIAELVTHLRNVADIAEKNKEKCIDKMIEMHRQEMRGAPGPERDQDRDRMRERERERREEGKGPGGQERKRSGDADDDEKIFEEALKEIGE